MLQAAAHFIPSFGEARYVRVTGTARSSRSFAQPEESILQKDWHELSAEEIQRIYDNPWGALRARYKISSRAVTRRSLMRICAMCAPAVLVAVSCFLLPAPVGIIENATRAFVILRAQLNLAVVVGVAYWLRRIDPWLFLCCFCLPPAIILSSPDRVFRASYAWDLYSINAREKPQSRWLTRTALIVAVDRLVTGAAITGFHKCLEEKYPACAEKVSRSTIFCAWTFFDPIGTACVFFILAVRNNNSGSQIWCGFASLVTLSACISVLVVHLMTLPPRNLCSVSRTQTPRPLVHTEAEAEAE